MNPRSSLNRQTVSEHLAARLRHRLGGRRTGFRLPTEKELASELGVSIPTVRKTLESLALQEALITQAEGRGWKVTPHSKDSRIAILHDIDLSTHSYLTRLQTSRRLLEAAGRDITVYLGDSVSSASPPEQLSCPQFLRDLTEARFSGVLATWAYPDEAWLAPLREAGIPVVGFGLLHENMVSYDVEAYLRKAIHELKARGRRRIAYLSAVSQWNLGGYDQERKDDVRRLLIEAGLEVEELWLQQEWHTTVPGAIWSAFRELWTARKHRPDGVILTAAHLWKEFTQVTHSLGIDWTEHFDITIARESGAPSRIAPQVIEFTFDSNALPRAAIDLLLELIDHGTSSRRRHLIDAWQILSPEEKQSAVSREPYRASPLDWNLLQPL